MEIFIYCFLFCLLATMQITFSQENFTKDYCKTQCGSKHFACNQKDEGFGRHCKKTSSIVDLEPHKELILKLHNLKRASVASGKEKFSSAGRMGEVAWDEEFAYLARISCRQCQINGAKCRSTDRFPNPGHNAALMRWRGERNYTVDQILRKHIKQWTDASKGLDPEFVKSYPKKPPSHAKFFANMVIESNNRVGCAGVRFMDAKNGTNFILICFYPQDIMPNMPLYQIGPAASACNSNPSSKFSSLCNVNEIYNYAISPQQKTEIIPTQITSPIETRAASAMAARPAIAILVLFPLPTKGMATPGGNNGTLPVTNNDKGGCCCPTTITTTTTPATKKTTKKPTKSRKSPTKRTTPRRKTKPKTKEIKSASQINRTKTRRVLRKTPIKRKSRAPPIKRTRTSSLEPEPRDRRRYRNNDIDKTAKSYGI